MPKLAKILLAALCLAGGMVGASVACHLARAEEPPPVEAPLPDDCRAWIEWLVDGKPFALMGARISINGPGLLAIAETCLGREPDWTAEQPDKPDWTPPALRGKPPKPPVEPDAETPDEAEKIIL